MSSRKVPKSFRKPSATAAGNHAMRRSPSLPAGLVLDPQTCAITGTPKVVSPATIYTIPGSNAAVPHESRSKSRPTPLHRRRDAHD
ncbi:Ig domain-containing protein [Paraburkholderia hospita]